MKRFVLLAALLLAAPAFAQAPREITADNIVHLRIGQTRVFELDRGIESFENTSDAIVKASAVRTDQNFTLQGVGPGEAMVTINFQQGGNYRMRVIVGGRTVRIYGLDDKDYVSFFCTSTDCGRADGDAPKPAGVSIEKRGRDRRGNIVTTTKNY